MTPVSRGITAVMAISGPRGHATLYRYPPTTYAPQANFWLVEHGGAVLHVTHQDLGAPPWRQAYAGLSWCVNMAYLLTVSECWGAHPTAHNPDSYDDLSDPLMQCAYPAPTPPTPLLTGAAGDAHAALFTRDLISGRLDFLSEQAAPPTPFTLWDAYWADLNACAARAALHKDHP